MRAISLPDEDDQACRSHTSVYSLIAGPQILSLVSCVFLFHCGLIPRLGPFAALILSSSPCLQFVISSLA